VEATLSERLVPVLNDALGVALANRRGVGVHGVEQNLDVSWPAAFQIFLESVGMAKPASSSAREKRFRRVRRPSH